MAAGCKRNTQARSAPAARGVHLCEPHADAAPDQGGRQHGATGRDVAINKNTKVLDSAQDEFGSDHRSKGCGYSSRRSIAGFKLREGMPIGVCVTLRVQHVGLPIVCAMWLCLVCVTFVVSAPRPLTVAELHLRIVNRLFS